MNNQIWPLKKALEDFKNKGQLPLHMPGHKQGRGINPAWQNILGQAAAFDYTELPATDDLSQATGPIKESQELLARLYGAQKSFYLINGTSGGIMAAVLAMADQGDKVLLLRNSHRSVSQGLILSGARPVYLRPGIDPVTKINLPPTVEEIAQKLKEHPDIKACFLTSPCFYGLSGYLKDQIDLLHKHNIPVFVDEAHGVHLHFSPLLAPDALSCGADLVAQSTHKTLNSFTQSSWLHLQGSRVNPERLKAALRMVQTTSASYILLLSLESAMAQMYEEGPAMLQNMLEQVKLLRQDLTLAGFTLLEKEQLPSERIAYHDISKLYVNTSNWGVRGYRAASILREHGIEPELSDYNGVLMMFTLSDTTEFIAQVGKALKEAAETLKEQDKTAGFGRIGRVETEPQIELTPREAWFSKKEKVSVAQAPNRIAAETVTIYPPGVPILLPGELITEEILEYLQEIKAKGGNIVCDDPSLNTFTTCIPR